MLSLCYSARPFHCGGFCCCSAWGLDTRLQWLRSVGFSTWCSRAELPFGMLNLPGSRIKPVSPALAGRFLTTRPPEKPSSTFFSESYFFSWKSQFPDFSHSRSNSFISLRPWESFFSLEHRSIPLWLFRWFYNHSVWPTGYDSAGIQGIAPYRLW